MKIKVLHLVWSLGVGGLENWLLSIAKHFDRTRFSMDFAAYADSETSLTPEFLALNCPVYLIDKDRAQALRCLIVANSYDAVHLHFCPAENPLELAAELGVPLRIFHNHNSLPKTAKVYRSWLKPDVTGDSAINQRLAVSRLAGYSKFKWRAWLPNYYQIIPAGIELQPFREVGDLARVRQSLKIAPNTLVVGHVGRLDPVKNHSFLLRVAAELAQLHSDFLLIIVGGGPESARIRIEAENLGIAEKVMLLGESRSIARVMCGAIDVFVFPSLHEGMPLSVIEAQAAGLPCLISDTISKSCIVQDSLVTRMSLRLPPIRWAEQVLRVLRTRMSIERAIEMIENSSFEARKTVRLLERFYLSRMYG